MYRIEKSDFGFKLTFGGLIDAAEVTEWLRESEKVLAEQEEGFYVFVDMRKLVPISEAAQNVIADGQRFYKKMGMIRSVVILSSPVVTQQFKRIAQDTGIYEWERYVDSSTDPDWEQIAMDWLLKEIDPDYKEIPLS